MKLNINQFASDLKHCLCKYITQTMEHLRKITNYMPSLEIVPDFVLRLPLLLLLDVWYRGCDKVAPCALVLQRFNGTALWNDAWPPSHFGYIRHALILTSFCLLFASKQYVINLCRGSWKTISLLHCSYLLCQWWSFTDTISQAEADGSNTTTTGVFFYLVGSVLIALICAFVSAVFVDLVNSKRLSFHGAPRLFMFLHICPMFLQILGWPASTIFWVNAAICRLAVAITPFFILTDLILICCIVGMSQAKIIYKQCLQLTIVPYMQSFMGQLRLTFAPSWALVFTSNLLTAFIRSDYTASFFSVLSSTVSESASSPFCLIGMCFALSYSTSSIVRLVVAFLHFNRSAISEGVALCQLCDPIVAVLLAVDSYLLNITLLDNIFLLLIIMHAALMPNYILPEIASLLTSTLGGRCSWLRVRILVVCAALIVVPLLATVYVGVAFGLSHGGFVSMLPSLLIPVKVVQIVITHQVEEFDIKKDDNVIKDVDHVITEIKKYAMYVEWFVIGVSILFAAFLLLTADWMWAVIFKALANFHFNAYEPYLGKQAAKRKQQYVKQVVQFLGKPTMLNDACAICQTPMKLCQDCSVMPCCHVYHSRCLIRWFEVQQKCPACNLELPPYVDVSATSSTIDDIWQRLADIVLANYPLVQLFQ